MSPKRKRLSSSLPDCQRVTRDAKLQRDFGEMSKTEEEKENKKGVDYE